MREIAIVCFTVLFLLMGLGQTEETVYGMEGQANLVDLGEFNAEEIQDFLNSVSVDMPHAFSFREMMGDLMAGNLLEVFENGAAAIRTSLFSELRTNAGFMGQIFVLAIVGAVFSGFAGIFGSGHVSETGFYVVYLLTMAFLTASFFSSMTIASEILDRLLTFMRVLLPAYFMAVAMAGSAITSAAVCGFTLGAIGLIQSLITQILLPVMRIYMLLVLAGNLYKEDMISKITELLGQGITWTCRSLFGVVVGFHVIQGMILPQADALKHASVMRVAQMIPGIGGAGAVSQMVLGSGILIKNTAGAAAVVILLFLAAVPVIKLTVLMVLYYLAAAAMQPVCDKRLVACMTGTAVGHGLLLKMVGYSLALFAATIAVICVSTNAAWYAG